MIFLEYVQTDGYCWFDTGIIPDINTRVEVDYIHPVAEGGDYCCEGYVGAQNYDDAYSTFQIRQQGDYTDHQMWLRVGNRQISPNDTATTWRNVSLDKDYFKVNDHTYQVGATSFDTCNYTLFISAIHNPYWDDNYTRHRASASQIGRVKVYSSNVLVGDFVPANNNGVIGYYDLVSETFKANLGTGTPIASPNSTSINVEASKTYVSSAGETFTITVTCENSWTVVGSAEWLTLSQTSGTGNAEITATVAENSGDARDVTLNFYDETTEDNVNLTINQKRYTSGQPVYLGGTTITEMFLGGSTVTEAYLGEDLVYSSGPFVGLKVIPSTVSFNNGALQKTVDVKSSESWTMTVPSWISASVLSGGTGVTTVTLTATAQSSSTSGTISVVSSNYSASATVEWKNQTIIVPDDEMWYKSDSVQTPFRPASWFTDDQLKAQGLKQEILSNGYDASDGWYKIKWKYPLRISAGSGFYYKALYEVAYPDTFVDECAENFIGCSSLRTIRYGESAELGLEEGAWPSGLREVYCYSRTEPYEKGYDSRGNYGRNVTTEGVFHYPAGANWSTFISTLPSGWTAVDDL